MTRTEIDLLGRFGVRLDGSEVADGSWVRRSASGLVKLLALSPGRILHRESVLEALWPDVPPERARSRLHTATHHVRRALADRTAVALRGDLLALLPGRHVEVDVTRFVNLAGVALRSGSGPDVDAALASYGGRLLPDDEFEPWTTGNRDQLEDLHADVLRAGRRWEELLRLRPAEEQAHLEVMRATAARGDVRAAVRQFERLDRALRDGLGTVPSDEARALRDQLVPAIGSRGITHLPRLVGRDRMLQRLDAVVRDLSRGRGATALISGPPATGTSLLLAWVRAHAGNQGARVGTGGACAAEEAWPYAAVLEGVVDLCRLNPSLVSGLDDVLRQEIERAMRGEALHVSDEGGHQRLFLAVAQLLRVAASGHGVVLTVDDLSEADHGSLRLLHYVARTTVRSPVLIVAGFRRGAEDSPLEQWRASLLRRHIALDLRTAAVPPVDETLSAGRSGPPVTRIHSGPEGSLIRRDALQARQDAG